jgi:hypothetical protein
MALRPVLGVWLCGPGKDAAAAVPGSPAVPGRTHRRPTTSQPAALPRSSARAGKVLGNVPAVAAEASRPYIQDRGTEVERRRRCTAPNSNCRSQRCRLVRGPGLLPDAHAGRIHCPCSTLRLYETHHPNSRARDTPRVPETCTWRCSGACRLAADARKRPTHARRDRRPLSPRPHTRGRLRVVALSQLSGNAASERRGARVSCLSGRLVRSLAEPAPRGAGPLYSSLHRHPASGYRNLLRPDASSHVARESPTGGVDTTRVAPRSSDRPRGRRSSRPR